MLTVLIWNWDLIGIRSFEIGICGSDVELGFRFWSCDLGFDFSKI